MFEALRTYFCFSTLLFNYLHCPVLVPTKSTERWRRLKSPLQKKKVINSATWTDIRRARLGSSEILEEKEGKCFIMHHEKLFHNSASWDRTVVLQSWAAAWLHEGPGGVWETHGAKYKERQFKLSGPLNVSHPASPSTDGGNDSIGSALRHGYRLECVTLPDSAAEPQNKKKRAAVKAPWPWKRRRRVWTEKCVWLFYIRLKFETCDLFLFLFFSLTPNKGNLTWPGFFTSHWWRNVHSRS